MQKLLFFFHGSRPTCKDSPPVLTSRPVARLSEVHSLTLTSADPTTPTLWSPQSSAECSVSGAIVTSSPIGRVSNVLFKFETNKNIQNTLVAQLVEHLSPMREIAGFNTRPRQSLIQGVTASLPNKRQQVCHGSSEMTIL